MNKTKTTPREQRKNNWLALWTKVCPRCGTILALDAEGCSTCLQQFKRSNNNVKRMGTRRIKTKQN